MFVANEVMMERFKSEKYPVVGLHGEFTSIVATQEEAARLARRFLKDNYRRESIICRFATKSEIVAQLEKQIQTLKEECSKYNSPARAVKASELTEVKETILRSMK